MSQNIHNQFYTEGYIFSGFDYRNGNDNQVVPIGRLINGTLLIVNSPY
jgi:hypothetical protein